MSDLNSALSNLMECAELATGTRAAGDFIRQTKQTVNTTKYSQIIVTADCYTGGVRVNVRARTQDVETSQDIEWPEYIESYGLEITGLDLEYGGLSEAAVLWIKLWIEKNYRYMYYHVTKNGVITWLMTTPWTNTSAPIDPFSVFNRQHNHIIMNVPDRAILNVSLKSYAPKKVIDIGESEHRYGIRMYRTPVGPILLAMCENRIIHVLPGNTFGDEKDEAMYVTDFPIAGNKHVVQVSIDNGRDGEPRADGRDGCGWECCTLVHEIDANGNVSYAGGENWTYAEYSNEIIPSETNSNGWKWRKMDD